MLTLMVRGIFTMLEFPYANFPTQGVTGHMLYWMMWEAVRRLEAINLKVIVFLCDGAKPKRRFFKMLGRKEDMKNGIVYKTINRYCRKRYIYLISDVPHLIKTTRNCWNSSKFGGARCMWVCATKIVFHILYVYVWLFSCNRKMARISYGTIYWPFILNLRQKVVFTLAVGSHMSMSSWHLSQKWKLTLLHKYDGRKGWVWRNSKVLFDVW
jgi:hypothetical protein